MWKQIIVMHDSSSAVITSVNDRSHPTLPVVTEKLLSHAPFYSQHHVFDWALNDMCWQRDDCLKTPQM